MESQPAAGKAGRHKAKNKKAPAKTKTPKKRKSDGPTCSMFLAELTRKLAHRRKQEKDAEETMNIVQTIIEAITNALPVSFSTKTLEKRDSPMQIDTLQTLAPELIPNDTLEIPMPLPEVPSVEEGMWKEESEPIVGVKMPVMLSDVLKPPVRKEPVEMMDEAVNTGGDHDVASEIAKHVGTLRKISLIAEEFNQKTAKSLKEIVESVQEDLIKKLEEVQAEQKARALEIKQMEELNEPLSS